MITGIWYAIKHDENIEFHMFPVESDRCACKSRVRGQDNVRFVLKGAPTRATGCVCRECWKIYSDLIIGSAKLEDGVSA